MYTFIGFLVLGVIIGVVYSLFVKPQLPVRQKESIDHEPNRVYPEDINSPKPYTRKVLIKDIDRLSGFETTFFIDGSFMSEIILNSEFSDPNYSYDMYEFEKDVDRRQVLKGLAEYLSVKGMDSEIDPEGFKTGIFLKEEDRIEKVSTDNEPSPSSANHDEETDQVEDVVKPTQTTDSNHNSPNSAYIDDGEFENTSDDFDSSEPNDI